MGCRQSSPSSVEVDDDLEDCSERGRLLASNGYVVERERESLSPERKPADGGNPYPARSTGGSSREETEGMDFDRSRESRGFSSSTSQTAPSRLRQKRQLPVPPNSVREAASSSKEKTSGHGRAPALNRSLEGQPSHGFAEEQQPRNKRVESDSAVHVHTRTRKRSSNTGINGPDSIKTAKGKDVMNELKKAYSWKEQYDHPSHEFLALMDRLYMECQLHLTALSSRGDPESRREVDTIVSEMVALRNYWGPQLLPSSTCNAFVRERISLTLGVEQRQFRIDCAQFFEPVPFYGSQQNEVPGELMKLYRFSVYNMAKNEVVLRYYLERSRVVQLFHVLCFTCENYRGQVKPYGTEVPSYWDIRQNMLEDVYSRLLTSLSYPNQPVPHTTVYAPNTRGTPAYIQANPYAKHT